MTREKALTEILRRAHREHGTCVLLLRRLDLELADLCRIVARYTATSGDQTGRSVSGT